MLPFSFSLRDLLLQLWLPELLQTQTGENLTQVGEHLLIVLANADRDANTILAAIVTRSIAHQNATLAHPDDEGFALFAEMEEHKIGAAGPEM